MKLLFDTHQLIISSVIMESQKYKGPYGKDGIEIKPDLVRHMVLSSIRKYKKMFNPKFRKDVILCFDGKNYWRKKKFPFYKAGRKKDRDQSILDWKTVYECINTIKNEFQESMPYTIMEYEGAEADDIIATVCRIYGGTNEEITIISSDKDLLQLQKWSNIHQYSPWHQKHLVTDNPNKTLIEHVIFGDHSDGIPNCLSPDDCLALGNRQSAVSKKRLNTIMTGLSSKLPSWADRGFARNRQLIDLDYIPEEISSGIRKKFLNEYEKEKNVSIYRYFQKNQLVNLMQGIAEF